MDKKYRNIAIIAFSVIIVLLLIIIISLCVSIIGKNKASTKNEDIYNKKIYASAKLPDISGTENFVLDEFGKKTNISDSLKETKRWMNLQFTDFVVYSVNSKNSVILFTINNNNNMIIETGKFQLQLKDDSDKVVSIIDFDEVVLPSGGKIDVTVDVDGDITNVKNIVVDDINYKMNLQEVKQ